MKQTTLFDEPDTTAQVKAMQARRQQQPLARQSDHDSSHEAAARQTASGKKEAHIQRVTDLVFIHPGKTSKELAGLCEDLSRHEIARRLPDAEKRGLVRRVAESGKEIVWWPK